MLILAKFTACTVSIIKITYKSNYYKNYKEKG